ncbi:hypothetical protein [Kitasatospora sp. NPDC091276]|uniref:hypothetical protein n=1 Tax=Kitasatospora sp. NPDC091276 TaxID=3155300 RepID=UPI0034315556
MLDHPSPVLRAQAASLWLWLTPGQRDALLADPEPSVSETARDRLRILDPAAMEAELPEHACHSRNLLLVNYAVSHAVAGQCLAERRDLWSLARNPHTPGDIGAVGEMFIEPGTSWYEACAASADPRLRRVAATCPLLSAELVHRLAEDPDADVRHLLSFNHPLAPPALVLDAFIAAPRQRPYLLTLPACPAPAWTTCSTTTARTSAPWPPPTPAWTSRPSICSPTPNPASVKPRQPIRAFLSTCSRLC